MIEFYDISDFKTNNAKLYESQAEHYGLPLEVVEELHKRNQWTLGDSLNESENSKTYTEVVWKNFCKEFTKVMPYLANASKETVRNILLDLLQKQSSKGYWELLKYFMVLILTKSNVNAYEERNLNKDEDVLLKSLFRQNMDLMESIRHDEQFDDLRNQLFEGFNVNSSIENDITFYAGMQNMLQSLNKPWSNNLRAQSIYQSMLEYLQAEIEYLSNKDSIYSVDDSQTEIILNQLLQGYLSPENRQADVVRSVITDIQAFVFDLTTIVLNYVYVAKSDFLYYMNQTKIDKFEASARKLIEAISTSRNDSKLLNRLSIEQRETYGYYNVLNAYSLSDFKTKYTGAFNTRMKFETINDCLFLIKNLQNDFNLGIRKVINNFLTNSISFVADLNRVSSQLSRNFMYKN